MSAAAAAAVMATPAAAAAPAAAPAKEPKEPTFWFSGHAKRSALTVATLKLNIEIPKHLVDSAKEWVTKSYDVKSIHVPLRAHSSDSGGAYLAEIDFWQNADNGLYPAQDPAQDPHNLRCKIHCEADGSFELLTIRPHPYTVPTDGPVGAMLAAANRNIWRPAHYHVIVSAPGYVGLVTELFPAGSAYIDNDTVFGVREGLIVDFKPCNNAEVAKRYNLQEPFNEVQFEFCLVKN